MNKKGDSTLAIILLLILAVAGWYFFIYEGGVHNPLNSNVTNSTNQTINPSYICIGNDSTDTSTYSIQLGNLFNSFCISQNSNPNNPSNISDGIICLQNSNLILSAEYNFKIPNPCKNVTLLNSQFNNIYNNANIYFPYSGMYYICDDHNEVGLAPYLIASSDKTILNKYIDNYITCTKQ